jgi:hypothetical protein
MRSVFIYFFVYLIIYGWEIIMHGISMEKVACGDDGVDGLMQGGGLSIGLDVLCWMVMITCGWFGMDFPHAALCRRMQGAMCVYVCMC